MAEPEVAYNIESLQSFYDGLQSLDCSGDEKLDKFLGMLKDGTPFALSRMNDGEMSAFTIPLGQRFGRTAHTATSENLVKKFEEVLQHEQENYWIGLVCPECCSHLNAIAKKYVREDYPFQTTATALTNRNWCKFITSFSDVLHGKTVHWVGSSDQNLDMFQEIFNIELSDILTIPAIDGWLEYSNINDYCQKYDDGDVVLMSCGPISRILVKEWFEKRPNVSFVGVGSIFDPFTKNVWHACHRGWLRTGTNETQTCKGCNP